MKLEDFEWLAGLFEGEGCIMIGTSISRGYRCYTLKVRVTMTDLEIVSMFNDQWPSKVFKPNKPRRDKHSRRPLWTWGLGGPTASEWLALMRPFFRSDRVQLKADLGMEFQAEKSHNGHWHDSEYMTKQREYYVAMHELHQV